MGDFRVSKNRFDEFVVMDCPHCSRKNAFFKDMDTYIFKNPKIEDKLFYKKICDTCGVGFVVAEFNYRNAKTKTYYKSITDNDVSDGNYILDPNYKAGDHDIFFGPAKIKPKLNK